MSNRISKTEYYLQLATDVAKRGTCLRRNYGAVIVKNDEIISTGYTGAPRGVTNCSDVGSCFRMDNNIPSGTQYEKCLTGDTKVLLHDGTVVTIKELAEAEDKDYWVYACNTKTGNLIPTVANCFRKTAENRTDIYEIGISNAGSFRCTADHKVMLSDCTFKRADALVIGDTVKAMTGKGTTVQTVTSVRAVVEACEDVYCCTVPDYENFAIVIAEGVNVFVHNCRSVHAEQNAIISASRSEMQGATLYLSGWEMKDGKYDHIIHNAAPCLLCKRFIINAGITEVISYANPDAEDSDERYHRESVGLWLALETL